MKRQVIVAGTFEQALAFAKSKMLRRSEWVYMPHGQRQIIQSCARGSTIWVFGTYYNRRDWLEILEGCEARELRILGRVEGNA